MAEKFIFYLKLGLRFAQKRRLEGVVLVSGAVVMVFELAATRLLAPQLGTSLITWTSLIGVILASLSLGYYLGGNLADKTARQKVLGLILIVAAACFFIVLIISRPLLSGLEILKWPLQIKSLIAAIILCAAPSVCLGMVSPYAVKLQLHDLDHAGHSVGRLYALSTVGSLAGTFSAGWWLIPTMGTRMILVMLALCLFGLGAWLYFDYKLKTLPAGKWLILAAVIIGAGWVAVRPVPGLTDVDTKYGRVWIYDGKYQAQPARYMRIDSGYDSAMFLNSSDLVFDYTKYYRLAEFFNSGLDKALMIGGAAYSYPKDFLINYPRAELTVAEIDPEVTALAKKYFKLEETPRLIIKNQDGREFLNQTEEKYDAVMVDAFAASYAIPFQLTSAEAVQKIYNHLNPDGVVIMNVISALDGPKSRLIQSEYATYKKIFPQVYLFGVQSATDKNLVQNIILVASKNKIAPQWPSAGGPWQDYLSHRYLGNIKPAPILTDDWAPTDYFVAKTF